MDPGQAGITRRELLIGGSAAAALLAAAGAVGWRSWRVRDSWYRLSGAYGEPGPLPPAGDVRYEYGVLSSRFVSGEVEYGIATPAALAGRIRSRSWRAPLCVCLPGRGRGPKQVLEGNLRLADFAAQAFAERDVPPFVLVAVDGGDTYWHERDSGEDAMAMLLEELLPFCDRELAAGGRAGTAVMGWSMGGYGALRAAELRPGDFAAVCAVSAALWRSYDDGVGDAFDDAEDYVAGDVYAGAGRLSGVPVRLDCGLQDPFHDANVAFAGALPEPPAGGFEPGGHNDAYWRRVAPAEMDFVGAALTAASP